MRYSSNEAGLECRQCGLTGQAWGPYYSDRARVRQRGVVPDRHARA